MKVDIIRAWKDSRYRGSLSSEEQAMLPENPVGQLELTDDELKAVSGGQALTGGGVNSLAVGCASQQGTCQSLQGSACISQGGNCTSQGGNCRSQSGYSCNTTYGGYC